ncbi:uncharacterized protein LOC135165429 [Diachasmimorpha longicaudata]|uniref:uncharacterized protein LOC135165429 n=1 Tax=Diachasmimorpha longicaudata TaxID=58733 RepID=UPI0030B8F037
MKNTIAQLCLFICCFQMHHVCITGCSRFVHGDGGNTIDIPDNGKVEGLHKSTWYKKVIWKEIVYGPVTASWNVEKFNSGWFSDSWDPVSSGKIDLCEPIGDEAGSWRVYIQELLGLRWGYSCPIKPGERPIEEEQLNGVTCTLMHSNKVLFDDSQKYRVTLRVYDRDDTMFLAGIIYRQKVD